MLEDQEKEKAKQKQISDGSYIEEQEPYLKNMTQKALQKEYESRNRKKEVLIEKNEKKNKTDIKKDAKNE